MFNLDTVICTVKCKDGEMFPLTVEHLDARWLEQLMFAQPDNFDKCVAFIREVDLEKSYPLLYAITGDLSYNDISAMADKYDSLGADEKLLIAIYRLRGLKLAC